MFKTMFKSIFKFRICSYFMYLKVSIGNNMRLYFLKNFSYQKSHAGKDEPLQRKRMVGVTNTM